MFNVGDKVIIISDNNNCYDYTKVGSYGIVQGKSCGRIKVKFLFINNETWKGSTTHIFLIHYEDLTLLGDTDVSISPIIRKIRNMYARQYRKTGQSCFA